MEPAGGKFRRRWEKILLLTNGTPSISKDYTIARSAIKKKVEELAQNIKTFYQMDDKTYQTFAINARAHVKKEYSITKNALLLKAAYDKII